MDLAGDPDVRQGDLLPALQRGDRLHQEARLFQLVLGERHLVVVAHGDLRLQRHPRLEDHGVAAHEPQRQRLIDHPRLAEAPLRVVVEVVGHPRLRPDLHPVRSPQPVLHLLHPEVERLFGAQPAIGTSVVNLAELVPVSADVRPVLEIVFNFCCVLWIFISF